MIITRNKGIFNHGFYKKMLKGATYETINMVKKFKRKVINLNNLSKILNFKIIKMLNNSRKKSPKCVIKIILNEAQYNYFKKYHNLNGRYKASNSLLEEMNVEMQRFYSKQNVVTANNFKFRIQKASSLVYFKDKNLEKNILTSNPTLNCEFVKKFYVI
jgi:hypothetical protein